MMLQTLEWLRKNKIIYQKCVRLFQIFLKKYKWFKDLKIKLK